MNKTQVLPAQVSYIKNLQTAQKHVMMEQTKERSRNVKLFEIVVKVVDFTEIRCHIIIETPLIDG